MFEKPLGLLIAHHGLIADGTDRLICASGSLEEFGHQRVLVVIRVLQELLLDLMHHRSAETLEQRSSRFGRSGDIERAFEPLAAGVDDGDAEAGEIAKCFDEVFVAVDGDSATCLQCGSDAVEAELLFAEVCAGNQPALFDLRPDPGLCSADRLHEKARTICHQQRQIQPGELIADSAQGGACG